jgi:hypothetical protein
MIASYHCHTKWSDGDGEVADYIRAAHAKGIGEIGISDHYVLTPDCIPPDWGMPLDALDDYIEDVASATYAYQHSFCNIWNDFDDPVFRDHVFAYPTVNGVIDTTAWEGYREGVDDVRYLTKLQ